MPTLTIDGRTVSAAAGTTILQTARQAGIRIPTLCYVDDCTPAASCFLCAVEIEGRSQLAPSCALPIAEGMIVRTSTDEVRSARRMALELLLSDHVGDCLGPCRTGCPARFDIPGFLHQLSGSNFARAAEIASDFLALPAALGRICPRLCEERCHRCSAGDALSIGHLHRFAADRDMNSAQPYLPARAAASGKQVAIVGAGPAGLSAAYHLLRRGHAVTLYDAHPQAGGMLRWGIPAFRLPHEVLEQEIDVIRRLGGEFRLGQRLDVDFTLEQLRRENAAVFLAIGAQLSRELDCPGEELALPAVDFLRRVAGQETPAVGQRVLVLGGGNTAMDAARTAVRLGAASVQVVYRRSRREMPCLMAEVEAAEAEGVTIKTQVAPLRLERGPQGDLQLTCICMELGPPDKSGRARPVPLPGSEFTMEASCVIAAIGQSVDTSALQNTGPRLSRSGIAVDATTLRTSLPDVFAGGDAVTGADLAIRAVAAGRLAAVSIDQFLMGRPVQGDPEMLSVLIGKMDEGELAAFYRGIEATPRAAMPERPAADRCRDFAEVELGFPAEMVQLESGRCLNCGCWKADNCQLRQLATEYGADPLRFAGARRKFQRDGSHPEIVYEPGKCILCGACVQVATEAADGLGLTIVGRGFEATVAVPLRGTLLEGLPSAARQAVEVCPTGAIALKGSGHGCCSGRCGGTP